MDAFRFVGPYVQGGEAPHDPALAGFVGKRRPVGREWPDPDGNRAARRAYERDSKRKRSRGA